ncbi:hypothetical protein MASR1M66_11720 [Aminivibrio sp.]
MSRVSNPMIQNIMLSDMHNNLLAAGISASARLGKENSCPSDNPIDVVRELLCRPPHGEQPVHP